MPITVRMKHKATGELRDVFAIDAESYQQDEWERLEVVQERNIPKVVTTTLGKRITPSEDEDDTKSATAGKARR